MSANKGKPKNVLEFWCNVHAAVSSHRNVNVSTSISESTPYQIQDILKLLPVSTQASGSLSVDPVLQLIVGYVLVTSATRLKRISSQHIYRRNVQSEEKSSDGIAYS